MIFITLIKIFSMFLHLEKDLIHIHIVPVITIIFYINLYLLMQKGFIEILKDIRAFKNMHHSCGIYIADFCNIRVTVVDYSWELLPPLRPKYTGHPQKVCGRSVVSDALFSGIRFPVSETPAQFRQSRARKSTPAKSPDPPQFQSQRITRP